MQSEDKRAQSSTPRGPQSALRESEERYRELFEANPHPMWVYDLETLRFMAVNDAAVSHYGYTRDEFLGMTIKDIRPLEDVPRLLENVAAVTTGLDEAGVWRHRKKDGSLIDVEITSHTLDFAGRRCEVVMASDITARRRAEQALRESEERHRLLFVANPHPMYVHDLKNLRFLAVNDAAVAHYGYTRDEFLGMTLKDIRPPEDVPAVVEHLAAVTNQLRDEAGIWRHRKKDGTVIDVEITSHALNFGGVRARVVMANDITARKRAEDALRASQERYRAFIEQSSEAIWRYELEKPVPVNLPVEEQIDLVYLHAYLAECNDALARMYGYSRAAEIVGARLSGLMPRADPKNIEFFHILKSSGYRIQDAESHEVDKDGKSKYFLNNILGIVEDGLFLRAWGTQRDITERKRMEEALRESEVRFKSAFNNTPIGMALINTEGRFLQVNRAMCSILRYSEQELLATTFLALVHPADLQACIVNLNKFLADEIECAQMEVRHVVKDGPPIWIVANVSAVRNAAGRVLYFITQIQDITARKRAEEALRESEERYRILFEGNPHPAWLCDVATLRFLAVNDAAVRNYGHSREEFLRMTLKDICPPKDEPILLRSIAQAPEGHSALPGPVQNRKKDGTLIDVEIARYRFVHGGQVQELVMGRDVTERLRAEAERLALERKLQETQKLETLGVLAGGIAHDFNNLLAAILGNVNLADMQTSPDSPVRPYLSSIEVAAHRAADLCKQMLAYAGKARFNLQRINVNAIINEMANLLRVSIGKRILLKLNLAPSLPLIQADATQIRQVVMNLIINAAEAIGDKEGAISLATGVVRKTRAELAATQLAPDLPDGEYLFIEVTDTGSGMDEETRARIFDPFFSTKFTGRGLGLASVLGILRGHRGAIELASVPGQGSTFRMLLPCQGGPETQTGAVETMPKLRGTILVVEDDAPLRELYGRMLESMGLSPLLTANGDQALEVLRNHGEGIAAVLLHTTMPGLSGEETYHALCRAKPGLGVILMSAYDQREAVGRFGDAGLARFLQKPFTPQELYRQLSSLLAVSQARTGE